MLEIFVAMIPKILDGLTQLGMIPKAKEMVVGSNSGWVGVEKVVRRSRLSS